MTLLIYSEWDYMTSIKFLFDKLIKNKRTIKKIQKIRKLQYLKKLKDIGDFCIYN